MFVKDVYPPPNQIPNYATGIMYDSHVCKICLYVMSHHSIMNSDLIFNIKQ